MTLQFPCNCILFVKSPFFWSLLHFQFSYLFFSSYNSQLTGTQVKDKTNTIWVRQTYKHHWSPNGMTMTSCMTHSLRSHSPNPDSLIFLASSCWRPYPPPQQSVKLIPPMFSSLTPPLAPDDPACSPDSWWELPWMHLLKLQYPEEDGWHLAMNCHHMILWLQNSIYFYQSLNIPFAISISSNIMTLQLLLKLYSFHKVPFIWLLTSPPLSLPYLFLLTTHNLQEHKLMTRHIQFG